jgi:GTP cyclohydrolase I
LARTTRPDRTEALAAVRTIIRYIGEDPDREGLQKTPDRVIRAWEHDWGIGYDQSFINAQRESILGGNFADGAERVSEMVAVNAIPFHSNCEHHMANFSGEVSVAYIPDGRILGLSKFARIVDLFSKRLQVQERLTNDIADFIDENCSPIGVGVVIKATHTCICSRGVSKSGAWAVSSALRGEMLEKPEVRAEFFSLVRRS